MIAITVRVPVPMSWEPFAISTEPSRPTRQLTTVPGRALCPQRDDAMPSPRFSGPLSAPSAFRRFQSIAFAPISNCLRRRSVSTFLRRSSSGSMRMAAASSSIMPSRANTPCGCRGARNARALPAWVRTSYWSLNVDENV